MRILLVEDDVRMRNLVRRGLAEEGHTVEVAASGPDGLRAAASGGLDAIVLDVMLPGCSGFEVVRGLRRSGNRTPVLMLTARDAAADIVAGLDAGADDYLVKPFAFNVLLARLRAIGRRAPAGDAPTVRIADVMLDSQRRVVERGGTPVQLTRTEFNLLECLMANSSRVVTRGALIERVWGSDRDVGNNTLDAFVKSLRHKLDAGGQPRLIHTVRGVGYTFRDEPES